MTEKQKQEKASILKELKKYAPNSKFSRVSEDFQKKVKRFIKTQLNRLEKLSKNYLKKFPLSIGGAAGAFGGILTGGFGWTGLAALGTAIPFLPFFVLTGIAGAGAGWTGKLLFDVYSNYKKNKKIRIETKTVKEVIIIVESFKENRKKTEGLEEVHKGPNRPLCKMRADDFMLSST